jgi:DNA primase
MSVYIVDILSEFLGDVKKHNEDKGQIAFDCPSCASEKGLYTSTDGKGNLEINYKRGYFRCWACGQRNNMKGVISKLFYIHGNKELLKRFNLVKPDYRYNTDEEGDAKKVLTTELPEGFMQLTESNSNQMGYYEAMAYLNGRGIGQEIINKFNIGFINYGKHKNRVIIPSYDVDGNVNYFIARSFNKWAKPKYLNAETPKEEIIFNHSLINPYTTIYLVEGPFDSLVVPNCIPLLGLHLHDNLYWYLQNNAKGEVVVILDGEAKKDGEAVYKKLNNLYLYNRVKIIYLSDKYDTSLIYEKFGNRGIKTILKTAKQMNERFY